MYHIVNPQVSDLCPTYRGYLIEFLNSNDGSVHMVESYSPENRTALALVNFFHVTADDS